jgi:hypothetical protein
MADRVLREGPTEALLIFEGNHLEVGDFITLKIKDGRLYANKANEFLIGGHSLDRAVVIAEGIDFPVGLLSQEEWPEPDVYRAYWEKVLLLFEAAGRTIIFTTVGPDLFAAYPERLARHKQAEADQLVRQKEAEEEEAAEAAYQRDAKILIDGSKRSVPVTMIVDGGNDPWVRRIGVKSFRVGPFKDHEKARLEFRSKGSSRTEHRAYDCPSNRSLVLLRGHGHGICNFDKHDCMQEGQKLTWSEIMERVRSGKIEVIFERLEGLTSEAEIVT